MAPESSKTKVLWKAEIWTETHAQGEYHLKIGIKLPHAKELIEARNRPGTGYPLKPSEGPWPCQELDLRFHWEIIMSVFKAPVCGTLLWQPQPTNTVAYMIGIWNAVWLFVLVCFNSKLHLNAVSVEEEHRSHRSSFSIFQDSFCSRH